MFVDDDVYFKPMVGGINAVYKKLYDICEAFFGRAELSYEEWLAAMEELMHKRVEDEVIDWWKRERVKRESREK